jgi:flavorubredoxin/ferredoxin-NADP reductase
MGDVFKAAKVSDNVYWVGAIDWDVRNFHGYLTSRGSTYNAFLILADKITLIDTVKSPFADEMFARIASVVEPSKIDYIVSNHSEMDHSGSLPQTVDLIKPKKVFASKIGRKTIASHFHIDCEITAVDDGDSVDLGNMRLSAVETRMCHWPDSMVTYLHEDELLFSQDAFGMHLASHERFADELDKDVLDHEALKYYANILMPLSKFIKKTLDKIGELGLPLRVVGPDHGPIRRRPQDIEGIIKDYARWASQKPTDKAVVIYDTMWHSTASMARAIDESLSAAGAKVKLMSTSASHRSDVAAELLEAGALVVGSPTINNEMFPTVADTMTYIKGLKPQNLVGAAFGSHGWSGEAPKHLHAMLTKMGVLMVDEPLRVNYVPDDEALARCGELGLKIAKAMPAITKGGKVESMRDLTHDIKILRVGLIEPERISFAPGQYIRLDVPGSVDPSGIPHPFSIASRPSDDKCIELIIRHMSDGTYTNWIFNRLKVGDEITFSGPYGKFGLSDSDCEMVWVAGGSGMSTFWSILRHMAESGIRRKCTFFFGADKRRDLYLLDELRQFESELDWFTFVPALSESADRDNWTGQRGLITEVLDRNLADVSQMEAYLCGSPGMIAAAMETLYHKGFPPDRIFHDKFVRVGAPAQ